MNQSTLQNVIAEMPDYLAIKVSRVAKDMKVSVADAVLFLVEKGINASLADK